MIVKKSIKKKVLDLLPAAILAFVASFMLIIYEPLLAYFTNMDDFWFDFDTIFGTLFLVAWGGVAIITLLFIIVFFVNNKFFKEHGIYDYILIISFGIFFATYIQGNFLVNNLPPIDGTQIDWSSNVVDMIISGAVLVVILAGILLLTKKLGREKVIKYSMYGSLAILALLSVSLVTFGISNDGLKGKGEYLVTTKNLNTASSDKNFFILVVDAVDGVGFKNVIKKNPEIKKDLADFTFFPDTMSGYAFSRDSMPFILSGVWNENETVFREYYNTAMEASPLIEKLEKEGYDINLYENDYEMLWRSEKLSNLEKAEKPSLKRKCFLKQEAKYSLFKYLPFYLKPLSKIETMNFMECMGESANTEGEAFWWWNKDFYDNVSTKEITKQDKKYFSFIHTEGAHVPFDLDKDLNKIEGGTYEQKIEASMTMVKAFIERLKKNKVYDNSVVVIMGDHGFTGMRQNPVFLVKGLDEKHEFKTSDEPVTYEDLMEIFDRLMEGENAKEALNGFNHNTRRFIMNTFNDEDHMIEYEQTGKAWESDTLVKTGKEFNR